MSIFTKMRALAKRANPWHEWNDLEAEYEALGPENNYKRDRKPGSSIWDDEWGVGTLGETREKIKELQNSYAMFILKDGTPLPEDYFDQDLQRIRQAWTVITTTWRLMQQRSKFKKSIGDVLVAAALTLLVLTTSALSLMAAGVSGTIAGIMIYGLIACVPLIPLYYAVGFAFDAINDARDQLAGVRQEEDILRYDMARFTGLNEYVISLDTAFIIAVIRDIRTMHIRVAEVVDPLFSAMYNYSKLLSGARGTKPADAFKDYPLSAVVNSANVTEGHAQTMENYRIVGPVDPTMIATETTTEPSVAQGLTTQFDAVRQASLESDFGLAELFYEPEAQTAISAFKPN